MSRPSSSDSSLLADIESPETEAPARGWSGPVGSPTTLILLRHGVTAHTSAKRFSGGLAGDDPALAEEGRDQVRAAAEWIAAQSTAVDAVVASPVRRTRESAEIAAGVLGLPIAEEPGFAEMEFGHWDGLTFAEVGERFPDEMKAWLGQLDAAPPGGESFVHVERRVLAGLDRLLETHRGRTVLVVSHVTPIKTLVARAVGAPLQAVFQMELSPASVSVLTFWDDGDDGSARGSMRLYNALPPSRSHEQGSW